MSAPRPRAVVVVAYGDPGLLAEALAPLSDEQIVVVDNSSAPATRALVEGLGHTYVDAGANLGFAAGVNVGLRHLATLGEPRDVLLLNPDARIEPEHLDALQAGLLAEDRIAAVAPSLVGPDGARHLTWYPLPSPAQMWRFAIRLPIGAPTEDFLIGASLMLRAEAIADVGLLDERYFLYGEEADWQRRAFQRGWRVAEVTEARALHHGGGSSDDDTVRIARVTAGQELNVRRWYGARGSASFRFAGWLAMVLRARSWPAARQQARCFRLGPRRLAPLPPSPRALSILHVALAGAAVPAELVAAQRRAGHEVTVAQGRREASRELRSATAWDVVHAHGRPAVTLACATGAWHGARVAAEPSVARRPSARLLRRRVDLAVAGPAIAPDYRQLAGLRSTKSA